MIMITKIETPEGKLTEYEVRIVQETYIEIRNSKQRTQLTLRKGGYAEYRRDSCHYCGCITGIAINNIQITRDYDGMKFNVSLYQFCVLNWDFNLEQRQQENRQRMQEQQHG